MDIYVREELDGTYTIAEEPMEGFIECVTTSEGSDQGYGVSQQTITKQGDGIYHCHTVYASKPRDLILSEGYPHEGNVFNINTESIGFINAKVTKLLINQDVQQVEWKATGGTRVIFTREEFISFAESISDYVESLVLN